MAREVHPEHLVGLPLVPTRAAVETGRGGQPEVACRHERAQEQVVASRGAVQVRHHQDSGGIDAETVGASQEVEGRAADLVPRPFQCLAPRGGRHGHREHPVADLRVAHRQRGPGEQGDVLGVHACHHIPVGA
ncbi:hypothetical protein HF577_17580 [Pseudonocardia xinjiangensis]|uniref:Uncharacterized protein n=1 Tax=Pseudonocardia xinjiangensis TaxID=75289 RepID=A0ABX1RIF8_9PSEU|nr:hypothetical protein [Pseudonocardia xinjiangensis]NMH78890.1 hypothetical protein [Pseudonocardia xinjiangensis]